MGQASSTIDFATALRDPTAFFSEPNDIVAHPQLSREMKLALLRQWEQTARSLSVAESEGMGGGEENKLGRVELAIALVEKQPRAGGDRRATDIRPSLERSSVRRCRSS